MNGTFLKCALLMGGLSLSGVALAQPEFQPLAVDVAVTYTAERAKVSASDCGCFWMQGGSVNASVSIYRGLGAVASFAGERVSQLSPGVDLDKVDFMAGPRYTLYTSRWTNRWLGSKHGTSLFGEGLFGEAHGFNTIFPVGLAMKSSANSFSMQFGGGLNLGLSRGFGLRALEVDYVRTTFPNGINDRQNDLRLSIGISYHISRPAGTISTKP